MVNLSVRTAAVADNFGYAVQFVFTAECAGVFVQLFNELACVVVDVHAPAVVCIPQERKYPVALCEPAILGDDLGTRFGGQGACPRLPQQHAGEGCVECGNAYCVFNARTGVADAYFHCWISALPGADVPPQFTAVSDEVQALVVFYELLVFGTRIQGAGKAGAREGTEDVQAIGLEAGEVPAAEWRRGG